MPMTPASCSVTHLRAGDRATQPPAHSAVLHRPVGRPLKMHIFSQERSSVKANAATLEAPSTSGSVDSYPTEAARRIAFTEDITPDIEPTEVNVQGSIPAWLRGSYVRNGPGTFRGMKHLFDGYGMLVKFAFDSGKLQVSHRFVETAAYKAFKETGQMKFSEFGTQIKGPKALWNTFLGLTGLGQGFTDNSSVHIIPTADGKLLSMTETLPGQYLADMDLNTLGRVEFKDGIKGDFTTAHPTLLTDDTLIQLVSGFTSHYKLVKQDRTTNFRELIAEVPIRTAPAPSWIHDFPVAQNYAIVPETPVIMNMKAAIFGGADYVMFDWKPELRSLLHLVDLRTGDVRSFDAPPYFTFHYINAFETADGSALCFDVSKFGDPEFLNGLYLENTRSHKRPIAASPIMRVTVPLDGSSSSATMKNLMKDDSYTFCELPRVNPNHKGKEYRYAYAVTAKVPTSYGNALGKFDMVEGEWKRWHEPGCIPVEPVMVPRPGAKDEDDGVVLSIVAGADGRSFLLVLDAGSFEETARAYLPHGIPYGFHGSFVPAS